MQDLRQLTLVVFCLLLALSHVASAELVKIATWNLEWFPGHKPTSTAMVLGLERLGTLLRCCVMIYRN